MSRTQKIELTLGVMAVLCWGSVIGWACYISWTPPVAAVNENPILKVLGNTVTVVTPSGHGSGVILEDGYVITAGHCVHDGMVIQTLDGAVYGIFNTYISEEYDVAILRVPDLVGGVDLADPNELALLDHVWMLGTPLDLLLEGTMTDGYLVNLDRDIYAWVDAYQVSAVSAPGNSGGPVINDEGELIGILVGGPAHIDPYSITEPIAHILETIEASGWFNEN